jgi:hypothetical protein
VDLYVHSEFFVENEVIGKLESVCPGLHPSTAHLVRSLRFRYHRTIEPHSTLSKLSTEYVCGLEQLDGHWATSSTLVNISLNDHQQPTACLDGPSIRTSLCPSPYLGSPRLRVCVPPLPVAFSLNQLNLQRRHRRPCGETTQLLFRNECKDIGTEHRLLGLGPIRAHQ